MKRKMKENFDHRMLRLLFAVPFVLLMFVGVQAVQAGDLPQIDEDDPDCRECHWDIFLSWEESAHGRGLSCGQCHLAEQQDDHAREGHGAQSGPKACMSCHTTGYDPETDTWKENDIHCTACHTPVTSNHPDEPMPTDRSEELCGQCHIEARFEWQISKHGQAGVACVSCHNQHATSLRSDSISEQCALCHGIRVTGFSHSEHDVQGLSCADCHLAPIEGPIGEGTAKRNHSFAVELSTCTSCHAYQLHNAKLASIEDSIVSLDPPEVLDAMASNITVGVCPEPAPINPFGLAMVVGLVGLGAGIAIVLGLYGFSRRNRGKVG